MVEGSPGAGRYPKPQAAPFQGLPESGGGAGGMAASLALVFPFSPYCFEGYRKLRGHRAGTILGAPLRDGAGASLPVGGVAFTIPRDPGIVPFSLK